MHGRIAHRMGLHGTGKHYLAITGALNNGAPAQRSGCKPSAGDHYHNMRAP